MVPVIIINHCQGSKPAVLICRVPKLMKPEIIWAKERRVGRHFLEIESHLAYLFHSLRLSECRVSDRNGQK